MQLRLLLTFGCPASRGDGGTEGNEQEGAAGGQAAVLRHHGS